MSRSRSIFIVSPLLCFLWLAGTVWAQTSKGRAPDQEPGWLGVSIQDVTGELREALPRSVKQGVIVNAVVDESPADEAGLKEGDIITRFDNQTIRVTADLTRAVRAAGADQTADIEYYRDGRLMRGKVKLGEQKEDTGSYAQALRKNRQALRWFDRGDNEGDDEGDRELLLFDRGSGPLAFYHQFGRQARLGVKLMDLGEQLADYFEVNEDDGPLVTEVLEDSPAASAGLKAGDVITKVGDESVEDVEDVRQELEAYNDGGSVQLEIIRHGRRQTVTAELPKRERRFGRLPLKPGDMPGEFYMQGLGRDRDALKKEMDQLRQELKDMRKELSELKSRKP